MMGGVITYYPIHVHIHTNSHIHTRYHTMYKNSQTQTYLHAYNVHPCVFQSMILCTNLIPGIDISPLIQ